MPDESPSSPANPVGTPIRRVQTGDESSQFRHKASTNRFSKMDALTPSIKRSATETLDPGARRRSSGFSDYSFNEARKTFQTSTDDLLLPRPSATGLEPKDHESSAWHSAPLAFALLPALGGMLFQNGSSVITDIMLLGLAAIFLNWSVRLPWLVSLLCTSLH